MSTATSNPPAPAVEGKDRELAAHSFEDPFLLNVLSGSDNQHIFPVPGSELDNECFPSFHQGVFDTSLLSEQHNPASYQSQQTSPNSHQDFVSITGQTDTGLSDFTSFTSPDPDPPFFHEDKYWPSNTVETSTLLWVNPQDIEARSQGHMATTHPNPNGATAFKEEIGLITPPSTVIPTSKGSMQPISQVPNCQFAEDITTSPQSIRSGRHLKAGLPARQLPALHTASNGDMGNNLNGRDLQASPIVKVSSFSRGDSPSRSDHETESGKGPRGRATLSSGHLSPAGDNPLNYAQPSAETSTSPSYSAPPPASRAEDGSWHQSPSTGQRGLDPTSRHDVYVPSIKDIAAARERAEKIADVELWLCHSEANSEFEDGKRSKFRSRRKKTSVRGRMRARSAGDFFLKVQDGFSTGGREPRFDDSRIPGPGVLINEQSGSEDGEDEESIHSSSVPESPPATIHPNAHLDEVDEAPSSVSGTNEDTPEDPLPSQFIRPRLWKDPVQNTTVGNTKYQPPTSNAAMMRFLKRAENFDAVSSSATWGTREVGGSDAGSIRGPSSRFSSIRSSSEKKKKPTRRNSLLEHAKGLLPKRSESSSKRKHTDPNMQQTIQNENPPKSPSEDPRRGSHSSRRNHSFSLSPKPQLNTGGAVMAMAGQMAAIGGGVGVPSPVSAAPTTPWSRRSRSRSELSNRSPNQGGLLELMASHGGPPIPILVSPIQDKPRNPTPLSSQRATPPDQIHDNDMDADDDEDELANDTGVTMDFPVRTDLIVPTLEGFKSQVTQLNPRLAPALIERIAQEQLRRYKRLIEQKIKHGQQASKGKCTSGPHCFSQGGEATNLPPRSSPKSPETTGAQFHVNGAAATDEELASLGDGTVTPALFPQGVPLPPVTRLPAEFECPLCFKVRKFWKPSDWTKHVHEDVQPFTCTFPSCTEPKSFKRKADWVRHESERHRHLEWWKCSMPDCAHTCYRKDNFVQHLVREHKMQEPKVKATKSRMVAGNKNQSQEHTQAVEMVWKFVEDCHYLTTKKPTDESCRFCGNVCNNWKKLSVHMARHMEQIAMPVLELVKQKNVNGANNNTHASPLSTVGAVTPQSQTHLWTPISSYSSKPRSPASHTQFSDTSSQGTIAPKAPTYTTSALLAEAFGVSHSPTLSRDLQASSSEYMPVITNQQQYATASARQYNSVSPYLQPQVSPTQHVAQSQQQNKQYNTQLGPSAYLSSYSNLTPEAGQGLTNLSSLQASLPSHTPSQPHHQYHQSQTQPQISNSTSLPYNVSITVSAPMTTNPSFEDDQLYASPIDNMSFMYPNTAATAQMSYASNNAAMSYPMITEAMQEPRLMATNGYTIPNQSYPQPHGHTRAHSHGSVKR
ncbi:hypothetical protein FQN57_006940 [Myotisia sp. PD_48]|nr:hypothetical protein FQN57_006940 [Myotisia sp. PD_48]